MFIKVNGESLEVQNGRSILDLIGELGISSKGSAVELNSRVIRSQDWGKTLLVENDVLEIVSFVAGG